MFERLAYGSECATWRNCYLMGADELRNGVHKTLLSAGSMADALSVPQLFDSIAIRIDGPRAWDLHAVADWHFTDLNEHYRLTLENGVLTHTRLASGRNGESAAHHAPDASFTLTKAQFLDLLAGEGIDGLEGVEQTGNPAVLGMLFGVLDTPDPEFAIVTR